MVTIVVLYLRYNVISSQLPGDDAPPFPLSMLHSSGLFLSPSLSITPTPTLAGKWIPPPDSGHFEPSLSSLLYSSFLVNNRRGIIDQTAREPSEQGKVTARLPSSLRRGRRRGGRMCVCVCVCANLCMRACVCVCAYIHILCV